MVQPAHAVDYLQCSQRACNRHTISQLAGHLADDMAINRVQVTVRYCHLHHVDIINFSVGGWRLDYRANFDTGYNIAYQVV